MKKLLLLIIAVMATGCIPQDLFSSGGTSAHTKETVLTTKQEMFDTFKNASSATDEKLYKYHNKQIVFTDTISEVKDGDLHFFTSNKSAYTCQIVVYVPTTKSGSYKAGDKVTVTAKLQSFAHDSVKKHCMLPMDVISIN